MGQKEDVFKLNLWEGDKIFTGSCLRGKTFSLKLHYDGNELKEWVLDGGNGDYENGTSKPIKKRRFCNNTKMLWGVRPDCTP